ncbi:MAG: hypothetical protein AAF743_02225, partial [Planctomycetota bacterium]
IVGVDYAGTSNEIIFAAVDTPGSSGGVWRSTNDGEGGSWTRRSNGLPTLTNTLRITGLAVDPTDTDIVHVTIGTTQGTTQGGLSAGGIYRTDDGGLNWNRVEDGNPTDAGWAWPVDFKHIDSSADGQVLWASDINWGSSAGLYRSTDRGLSWSHVLTDANHASKISSGNPFGDDAVTGWWVEIDPTDADVVYSGSADSVIKTDEGGATWVDVLNDRIAADTFRSTGFTGWVASNVEYNPYDADQLVTQGKDALKAGVSNDGGWSWHIRQAGLPNYAGGIDVSFADDGGQTMVAAFGQGGSSDLVGRSRDGGVTWQLIDTNLPGSQRRTPDGIHVDPQSPGKVWLSMNGKLWRSTNAMTSNPGSVNWSQVTLPGSPEVKQIESGTGGVFYVMTDTGVFRGTGSNNFTNIDGPTGDVRLAAGTGNTLFAATYRGSSAGLQKYDGSTWSTITLPSAAQPWVRDITVDPTDNDRLALVTNQDPYVEISEATGVWLSDDGGGSWRQENAALPMVRGDSITFDPAGSKLVVGLTGRGFFTAETQRTSIGAKAVHLTVAEDDAARQFTRNAGYIHVPPGSGNNMDPTANAPIASFTFELDQPMTGVTIEGRVRTPDSGGSDSFFVRVDDGPWQTWWTPRNATGFTWGTVNNLGITSTFDLDAGLHVVEFKLREQGTQLSQIRLAETPTQSLQTGTSIPPLKPQTLRPASLFSNRSLFFERSRERDADRA